VGLYAIAFLVMLAAGGVFVIASLGKLESLRLLRVSAGLSVAAIALAVASVLVPRRR
jgi:hypothetical protein